MAASFDASSGASCFGCDESPSVQTETVYVRYQTAGLRMLPAGLDPGPVARWGEGRLPVIARIIILGFFFAVGLH